MDAPNYKMYAGIGIVLSAAGMYYVTTTIGDPAYPDETSCNNSNNNLPTNYPDGTPCHVWDGSNCRQGLIDKMACVSKGSKLMQFFLLTFVVSLIALAGLYAMSLFAGKPKDESVSSPSVEASSAPLPGVVGEGLNKFRPFKFDRYRY